MSERKKGRCRGCGMAGTLFYGRCPACRELLRRPFAKAILERFERKQTIPAAPAQPLALRRATVVVDAAPCRTCGSTARYRSTGGCILCLQVRNRLAARRHLRAATLCRTCGRADAAVRWGRCVDCRALIAAQKAAAPRKPWRSITACPDCGSTEIGPRGGCHACLRARERAASVVYGRTRGRVRRAERRAEMTPEEAEAFGARERERGRARRGYFGAWRAQRRERDAAGKQHAAAVRAAVWAVARAERSKIRAEKQRRAELRREMRWPSPTSSPVRRRADPAAQRREKRARYKARHPDMVRAQKRRTAVAQKKRQFLSRLGAINLAINRLTTKRKD